MTGFGYGVRECQQFHALQIPAQKTAGMTVFYFIVNYLACHPGNFVAMK
jgi:hypothetical protein